MWRPSRETGLSARRRVWHPCARDPPGDHYLARPRPRRRRAASRTRAGGFFVARHPLAARPARSPTDPHRRGPSDDRRLPRLRHHAARRRPARGHLLLGGRQARRRAAARRARRRLHRGRLAGRACPRTPSSSRGRATELDLQHAAARRVRRHPQGRASRSHDDPQVRALLDSRAPVVTLVAKSDVRHVERGAAHHAGGEPRDGRATPSRYLRRRGPAGVRRLRALLRRLHARPRLRRRGCCEAAVEAGADGRRAVRHQRRHAARAASPRSSTDVRERIRRAARASTARTTPAARSPTPSPRSRPAPPTCSAPPTATASAPATPTCSPSSANLRAQAGHARACPRAACAETVRISHAIAEIANIAPEHPPGRTSASSAFAHKAGLHASAIKVDPELYNHIDPARGRQRHARAGHRDGRPGVDRAQGPRARHRPVRRPRRSLGRVVDRVKDAGGAGLDLRGGRRVVRAAAARRDGRRPPTALPRSSRGGRSSSSDAGRRRSSARRRSRCTPAGERIVATGEGNGPVNALDNALRRRSSQRLPGARDTLELIDYKVRILDGGQRHRRRDPRARSGPPTAATRLDHRRRARERHRGVVAGARGRGGLRPAQGRTTGGDRRAHRLGLVRARSRGSPVRTAIVSFGVVEGVGPDGEVGADTTVTAIVGHPFGASRRRAAHPATPTCGCSRRCCRARSSPSAELRRPRRARWATRCPTEPMIFLKPSHRR